MTDGAGTTVTDSSGNANHGTITGTYTWLNTPETVLDSPGSRIFAWGLDIGSDGVNDGLKLTLVNRDVVQNGGFGSDTKWSKANPSWTIGGGVAHNDGTNIATANIYQNTTDQLNGGVILDRLYKITFTLSNRLAGTVAPMVGGSTLGTPRNLDGTYTEYIRASGGSLYIALQASIGFIGDIDNVSCVEVRTSCLIRAIVSTGGTYTGQAKLLVRDETNGVDISQLSGCWNYELVTAGDMTDATKFSLGAGWAIAAGVAHGDAGSQSYLSQTLANQQNGGTYAQGLYKVTFTILNWAAGNVRPVMASGQNGTWRGADGTYTEYIRATNAASIYLEKDAAFHGDVDNWSITRVSEWNQPDILNFSFELPTAARGAAADCTSISVKLLNAAGSGVLTWHQVELLPNLLDNPSLDTGAVADPWIPYGETNSTLAVGDTAKETTIVHSTGGGVLANVGAAGEYFYQNFTPTVGKYYSAGYWQYLSASGQKISLSADANLMAQNTLASLMNIFKVGGASWVLNSRVARCATGAVTKIETVFNVAGPAQRYVDDRYLLALTDVPITVTPASYANSLEGTGVRIDGLDAVTQPVGNLQPGRGRFAWYVVFRHGAADFIKFGNVTPYLGIIYGDVNNQIWVRENAANQIRLGATLNGVTYSIDWNCAGLIAAGSLHRFDIAYTNSWIKLLFNLITVVTIRTVSGFAVGPNLIYVGQSTTNTNQADAVFSSLV